MSPLTKLCIQTDSEYQSETNDPKGTDYMSMHCGGVGKTFYNRRSVRRVCISSCQVCKSAGC